MNFVPFPSVEGFHNVVKYAEAFPDAIKDPILYRGKVKLHGTNAGIRLKDGEVAAQSRGRFVTPEDDNAGFAKWVEANKAYWATIRRDCTVFGEWCGQGIMSGTAINRIGKKVFAVFAVIAGDTVIADPGDISSILPPPPAGVYILPWHGPGIAIDYKDRASLQASAATLNAAVDAVEACDPWVKDVFGVAGIGEGIVYYPARSPLSVEAFANFSFKAKGEKHRVVKVKEAVQVAPEVAAGVEGFAAMFVTEARCQQGLAFVGGAPLMLKMKDFLQRVCADVAKESKAELEAAGSTWDQVQKNVTRGAREWFIQKSREI